MGVVFILHSHFMEKNGSEILLVFTAYLLVACTHKLKLLTPMIAAYDLERLTLPSFLL